MSEMRSLRQPARSAPQAKFCDLKQQNEHFLNGFDAYASPFPHTISLLDVCDVLSLSAAVPAAVVRWSTRPKLGHVHQLSVAEISRASSLYSTCWSRSGTRCDRAATSQRSTAGPVASGLHWRAQAVPRDRHASITRRPPPPVERAGPRAAPRRFFAGGWWN